MNETDLKKSPLVSVIIPTLNREKYIRQCIESVLSQDYPNLEVIVVDNGSTDSTPEILKSFGNRIKYLKEEKRGPSAARNKGIREARGEFIGLLDDDDYYLPGKISLSVQRLLEYPSFPLVYTDYILIDSEGRFTETVKKEYPPPDEFIWVFVEGFAILPSTTLIRKECFENIGYFDETMLNAHEDTDLWFRFLKSGYRFIHIPKPLTAYRLHPCNFHRLKENEEPIRWDWDKRLSSIIEHLAPEELFENLLKCKDWKRKVKREYDKLTDNYYFRRLPLSAAAAAKKAREIGGPTPHFTSFVYNFSQVLDLLNRILRVKVKMAFAQISPKLTWFNTTEHYRKKINKLSFKLRYRLFKIFRPNAIFNPHSS